MTWPSPKLSPPGEREPSLRIPVGTLWCRMRAVKVYSRAQRTPSLRRSLRPPARGQSRRSALPVIAVLLLAACGKVRDSRHAADAARTVASDATPPRDAGSVPSVEAAASPEPTVNPGG